MLSACIELGCKIYFLLISLFGLVLTIGFISILSEERHREQEKKIIQELQRRGG